jgi:hypothetical protein
VDGISAPVLRANGFVRAVYLESGEHIAEFAFKPRTLILGAACSAATFLLWLAAAILVSVRQRAHTQRRMRT